MTESLRQKALAWAGITGLILGVAGIGMARYHGMDMRRAERDRISKQEQTERRLEVENHYILEHANRLRAECTTTTAAQLDRNFGNLGYTWSIEDQEYTNKPLD